MKGGKCAGWKKAYWQGTLSAAGQNMQLVGIDMPSTCLDVRVDPGQTSFNQTLTFKIWAYWKDQRVDKTGFVNGGSGSSTATVTFAGGVKRFTLRGLAVLGWEVEVSAPAGNAAPAITVAAIAHGKEA